MAALLILRRFWPILAALAVVLAVWLAVQWHDAKVASAYTAAFNAGAAAQKEADRKAFAKAEAAATAAQAAILAKRKADDAAISKRTDDALRKSNARLAGDYDALRLRWEAYRADQGRAGQGGATAAPGAASVVDGAACDGFVPVEAAIAPSEAADRYAAQVNAWIDWYEAQARAWPR